MYTRNDDTDQSRIIENTLNAGEIVVSTNLAGRGTDFKLSEAVLEKGGLYVIMSFLPDNMRTEEQGLGRSARNGQKGSG